MCCSLRATTYGKPCISANKFISKHKPEIASKSTWPNTSTYNVNCKNHDTNRFPEYVMIICACPEKLYTKVNINNLYRNVYKFIIKNLSPLIMHFSFLRCCSCKMHSQLPIIALIRCGLILVQKKLSKCLQVT